MSFRKLAIPLVIGGLVALADGIAVAAPVPGGSQLLSRGSAATAASEVHGVCHNPKNDPSADLWISCADWYTHTPPPPKVPILITQFKVKTNHTPKNFLLVVKLYKWPSHGAHAHLYEFCIRNDKHVPCDLSWVTKDLPAPGHSELWEFRAECQPGRYYAYFQFHGVSSSGQVEHGFWYDPHPSNKNDRTPPNRQESHEISKC